MTDPVSPPIKRNPFPPRTNEERQAILAKANAARKAALEARTAATQQLGRYTLEPDTAKTATGEGAGWKLWAPKEPDRFFRIPEQAQAWVVSHP